MKKIINTWVATTPGGQERRVLAPEKAPCILSFSLQLTAILAF